LLNSSFDVAISSPWDEADSEKLELSSNLSREQNLIVSVDASLPLAKQHQAVQSENSPQPLDLPAQLDVKAELDSLWVSWQLNNPNQLNPELTDELGSVSSILATIATTETITHTQQLLQELNSSREQLTSAQNQLQVLDRRNQDRVAAVDLSILQAKQLKFRTQQLAQTSKNRVEKVREMLESISQIRTEIVTSLDKFGGYAEIHSMLAQLETTRHALVIAHDRATTGQEAFYDSLHEIQQQVIARSDDSEHKIHQYHDTIQSLSQTISIDRLQIAGMSVDLGAKLTDLHGLSAQITTIHAQVVEKSQTLQTKIAEIDRGFAALSQSVQTEKEQFYALTVESIEKTDAIGSQLAQILQQSSEDRDSISALKTEIASMRYTTRKETAQKLNNLNLHYQELTSTWTDFQARYKDRAVAIKKLSRWLWILSFAVGGMFILLVRMLISLK
jgi:chromosome segregation ATPase